MAQTNFILPNKSSNEPVINRWAQWEFRWYTNTTTSSNPFKIYVATKKKQKNSTHRSLYTWKPPSSKRIFANSTTFKLNGTSTSSSKLSFTSNLYFFFFIMNAMPAPGPINVIQADFCIVERTGVCMCVPTHAVNIAAAALFPLWNSRLGNFFVARPIFLDFNTIRESAVLISCIHLV